MLKSPTLADRDRQRADPAGRDPALIAKQIAEALENLKCDEVAPDLTDGTETLYGEFYQRGVGRNRTALLEDWALMPHSKWL